MVVASIKGGYYSMVVASIKGGYYSMVASIQGRLLFDGGGQYQGRLLFEGGQYQGRLLFDIRGWPVSREATMPVFKGARLLPVSREATIRWRLLFDGGGQYQERLLFKGGQYSREATITWWPAFKGGYYWSICGRVASTACWQIPIFVDVNCPPLRGRTVPPVPAPLSLPVKYRH